MLLQELPLEILIQVAGYLPMNDTEEFSRTCQNCYFAMLPHIWHHLSLHDTTELNTLAERLKTNDVWVQRAIQFVRVVSLMQTEHPKYTPTLAASMFGIAALPSDQAQEQFGKFPDRHERIGRFGQRLLEMFPHLSNLVLDFDEAVRRFCGTPILGDDTATVEQTPEYDDHDARPLPYSGSLSLINYKSDNTRFMHYLLLPFRQSHHLKLQASPVVSLCDDIDGSILTNEDIADLATMGLTHLRKLELSYLDANVNLETLKSLILSLPCMKELDLEWIFPPNKREFATLCQEFRNCGLLETYNVCKSNCCNTLRARFTRP